MDRSRHRDIYIGLSQPGNLTAPRVYYAMARDGLFFKSVGWLSPKTRVPVVAIILQGATATVIALSGRYEQILNYVISVDFISFGLTASSIFVFRRKDTAASPELYLTPGHPYTTGLFVIACAAIVTTTVWTFPGELRHRSGHSAGRHPGIFVLEPQIAAIASATEHH